MENLLKLENRLNKRIDSLFLSQKAVLTIGETATYTGKSISHLYKLTSKGEIPHYKQGRNCYFDRVEIEEWLKLDRVKTAEEIEVEASTYTTLNRSVA